MNKQEKLRQCQTSTSHHEASPKVEDIKKDLINQILSEAPEDKNIIGAGTPYTNHGFNQANQQWIELLTKHLI